MTDKTQTGVTTKQLAIVLISMIDEPTIIMNMVGREVPFLINTGATYNKELYRWTLPFKCPHLGSGPIRTPQ